MLHHCYRKCCSVVTKNAALEITENAAFLFTVYNFPSNPLRKAKDKPKTLLKTVYLPISRTNNKIKRKLLAFKILQCFLPKKKSKEHWRIGLLWLRRVVRRKWKGKILLRVLNCKINGDWTGS